MCSCHSPVDVVTDISLDLRRGTVLRVLVNPGTERNGMNGANGTPGNLCAVV